jgi:hypothetical protein
MSKKQLRRRPRKRSLKDYNLRRKTDKQRLPKLRVRRKRQLIKLNY